MSPTDTTIRRFVLAGALALALAACGAPEPGKSSEDVTSSAPVTTTTTSIPAPPPPPEPVETVVEPPPVTPPPVQPPPPQPQPEPAGDCDPAYPDGCIAPAPPDLDCPEVPHQDFTVLAPDPHGFDRDNDGVGCES